MPEFIIKYWLEFVFGIVIAIIGFAVKRTLKSYQQERMEGKEAFLESIRTEIRAEFERSNKKELELQNEIKILKAGLLSVQGRIFKYNCHRLLEQHHGITLEDYEELTKDHEAYNSLGGNHNGDQLYLLVRKKVEDSWANDRNKKE